MVRGPRKMLRALTGYRTGRIEIAEGLMKKRLDVTRRDFLTLAGGGASLAALTGAGLLRQPTTVLGANDRVRVGIIGLHGRGADHIKGFAPLKNLEIAALCDVDESVVRQRLEEIQRMNLPAPK